MSDLARQAAEHLTRIVWGDDPDPEELVADIIRSHGSLVSHEDAALLREVKRMMADMDDDRSHALDLIEQMKIGPSWKVRYDGVNGWQTGRGDTLTAALKSALDATGVPDAKGT